MTSKSCQSFCDRLGAGCTWVGVVRLIDGCLWWRWWMIGGIIHANLIGGEVDGQSENVPPPLSSWDWGSHVGLMPQDVIVQTAFIMPALKCWLELVHLSRFQRW